MCVLTFYVQVQCIAWRSQHGVGGDLPGDEEVHLLPSICSRACLQLGVRVLVVTLKKKFIIIEPVHCSVGRQCSDTVIGPFVFHSIAPASLGQ